MSRSNSAIFFPVSKLIIFLQIKSYYVCGSAVPANQQHTISPLPFCGAGIVWGSERDHRRPTPECRLDREHRRFWLRGGCGFCRTLPEFSD